MWNQVGLPTQCQHASHIVDAIYTPTPDRKKSYLNMVLAKIKKVTTTTQLVHIIIGGDFNLLGIKWEDMKVPPVVIIGNKPNY